MPARRGKVSAPDASVETRLGRLPVTGTNRWGMTLVACPNCGRSASVDSAGDVWCWSCNYSSSRLTACT